MSRQRWLITTGSLAELAVAYVTNTAHLWEMPAASAGIKLAYAQSEHEDEE